MFGNKTKIIKPIFLALLFFQHSLFVPLERYCGAILSIFSAFLFWRLDPDPTNVLEIKFDRLHQKSIFTVIANELAFMPNKSLEFYLCLNGAIDWKSKIS